MDVKLLLAVLVLVLIFLQVRLWIGAGSIEDIQRLEREISLQQSQNEELQARNEKLRKEVKDLKTGQDSIEERARSELGLIRKGETFYLIVEGERGKEGNGDNSEIERRAAAQALDPAPSVNGNSPPAATEADTPQTARTTELQ